MARRQQHARRVIGVHSCHSHLAPRSVSDRRNYAHSLIVASAQGTHHAGRGNKNGAGTLEDVGHYFAFGNTEESLHLDIYGCRKRGCRADGPFNHATAVSYTHLTLPTKA